MISKLSSRLKLFVWAGMCVALTAMHAVAGDNVVATHIASTERFAFYSDPWLNAHHFLYQWARRDENLGEGRQRVEVPERESTPEMSEAERTAWEKALTFYREHVAGLDHFDRGMLEQKFALLRLEGNLAARPEDKIEGLSATLASAMPVYMNYWWPAHDAGNRRWFDGIADELRHHEAGYVALTERLFGAEWPDESKRIDVSAYANFRAGYTAYGHSVIFASDPGNQGLYSLETVFHEVLHSRDIGGGARKQLGAIFESAGVEQPDNLWHSMIFMTAGAFTEALAEEIGEPAHTPYWQRERFDTFHGWREEIAASRRFWLPAVAGETTARAAMEGLAGHYAK